MDVLLSLKLQTLRIRKVVCVFPIPALTPASVPSCVSVTLPKWVKELTFSMGSCAAVTELLLACCILKILVLPLLMWRPLPPDIDDLPWFVCWLLNVPATCECISGKDLLRQVYVLPQSDRSCRPNVLSHPVTVYWHRADQSPGAWQGSHWSANF